MVLEIFPKSNKIGTLRGVRQSQYILTSKKGVALFSESLEGVVSKNFPAILHLVCIGKVASFTTTPCTLMLSINKRGFQGFKFSLIVG